MINLLPAGDQKQLAAARSNALLLRYTLLLGIFVIAMVIEIFGVYIVMNIGKMNNEATIKENDAKAISYAPVKLQATTFKTNLATAKYILNKQVPYTALMVALAQNLPDGAVIDKIAIDPAAFGTPSVLTVNTTSYDKAINVKTSLQNAKVGDIPLFSSVSFQSVSSNGEDSNASKYPYTAVYEVVYDKKALAI